MKHLRNIFSTQKRDMYCFADSLSLCEQLLQGGARIIQLREKKLDDARFRQLALDMQKLIRSRDDAVLIINDRVEIALQIEADGLHVGQSDENYLSILDRAPDGMIVGVSVDNLAQALDAQTAGATYVGAGAIFPTPTKEDAQFMGLEGLRRITAALHIPVVAIGGISLDNIAQVVAAGAHYFAVISHINDAENISLRLDEFYQAIHRKI
jgi:thiamine-phosphate pyrophosphorylase